ncbi:P1 family peptidase [Candidatus Sumerlaeota bacterium]|nr:P1 family peptidase [Candidatus Sumerlaeota bacterium]
MTRQKRIEDYGVKIGSLPKGKRNKITDVKGVKVGHCSIDSKENKTGVTIVLPHGKNAYLNKLVAACHVLNGFGKTAGLVQIEELGTLETPIALTNTLNVGLVHDALVEYMIRQGKKINLEITSINPVVCECSDRYLNNIQNRVVKKEHVFKAIRNCRADFPEGDVGGGKGLSCHQLKGGIGSASRVIKLERKNYTLGILAQSNYGSLEDLMINGKNVGKDLARKINLNEADEKGSIIMIIATDIPCTSRQLKRICKRAAVGLARVGSFTGHGSGEIMIAFSTANVIKAGEKKDVISLRMLNENRINRVFRAVAEACEEAVLNSMITAKRVVGYKGHVRESLKDYFLLIGEK